MTGREAAVVGLNGLGQGGVTSTGSKDTTLFYLLNMSNTLAGKPCRVT
jgi:hypothetical protein